MADLSKINVGAVSKAFSKLSEAAQIQKPRRGNREDLFLELREIQKLLIRNPQEASDKIEDYEIKLREAFMDETTQDSSAEDAALIERLKSRIDDLKEHYDRIIKQRDRKVKQLENRIYLISKKNQQKDTAQILNSKIVELESKLDELKKKRKLSPSQIDVLIKRIEDAKKRLGDLPQDEITNQMNDLISETQNNSDQEDNLDDEKDIKEESNDNAPLIENNDEDQNEQIPEEQNSEDEQVEDFGSGFDINEAVAAANVINSQQQVNTEWNPNSTMEVTREEPPDQIKAPNVPAIEEKEKAFGDLPDFNDDSLNFPMEDDNKKTGLSDKIKSLFKKN